jgi:type IV pilus assembly protein PilM
MAAAQGRAGSSFFESLFSGMNFSFGGSSTAVGLSIGASSVKVVELKKKKKQWALLKYASVPLIESTSEQREIANPIAVVESIQNAIKTAGITSKNVCSALAGSGLIIKNLTITVTNMKELQDQVYWEAEQYIPYEISEVVIDYQVIGQPKGDQVDVILVAVKKEFLEQYMSAITQAKLNPKVIDAELFALQNAYESNYPESETQSALLADVGALSTKIVICGNGIPYFTKDASFGGNAITQEIQRELNFARFQDAEALKVSNNVPQEVKDVLGRSAQNLAIEIKRALDFYSASSLGPPVTQILLSGGASRTNSVISAIKEKTGLPTDFLNPFLSVESELGTDSVDLAQISPEVVIPMGLAIRAGVEK